MMRGVGLFVVSCLAFCSSAKAQGGIITTIAGNGTAGYSGDGGPATSAEMNIPFSVAVDSAGNLYIADRENNCVRKVSNGVITTVAGNGVGGYSGDGGPATSAELDGPQGVAVDSAGNLYIADSFNMRVREVSDGVITTVAGNGNWGYSGDGGPATSAELYGPSGVAVDSAGNVYVADMANSRIRKVSNGVITTVAGAGTAGYNGDGGPATSAWLNSPGGVAVDSAGNLYIADYYGNRVRKVSGGIITTVAGNGSIDSGGVDPTANIGDGGPATSAELYYPMSVALDAAGNLYIADSHNNRIRKVAASTGVITTVAGGGLHGLGDSGAAANAELDAPMGVAFDSSGNLYIADAGDSRVRFVTPGGSPTCNYAISPSSESFPSAGGTAGINVAATAGCAWTVSNSLPWVTITNQSPGTGDGYVTIQVAPDFGTAPLSGSIMIGGQTLSITEDASSGTMYIITTVAGDGGGGDGGPAMNAQVNYPQGVAADAAGNVYIADTYNHEVRKVSKGIITTLAGNGTSGYSGDNGPATGAQLNYPAGVTVDAAGNLYIADSGNNRIRRISNGVIATVAGSGYQGYGGDNGPATSAELYDPRSVALDAAGSLYIADTHNNRIRKVSNGMITTVAGNGTAGYSGDGGPATNAELYGPGGVALDSAGNLYIADLGKNRIRKVDASTGMITTAAGNGSGGYSGDGGPATSAALAGPFGVAVDSGGNLYIADTGNSRIRMVGASTGVITTVAGIGGYGYSGDGGPAALASMDEPEGVAVDAAGNIYVADTNNSRVRLLTPYVTSLSAQAASLSTSAGGGSIQVTAFGGIAWTATSNASWITITSGASGSGAGTVAFTVTANTGAARSGTITIGNATFTIVQEGTAATSLNLAGSLAQIASAGGWDTSLTLVNLGTVPGEARLNFFADDGSAPWLPFTEPQQPALGTTLGSTLDQTLAAGASLLFDTTGPNTQATAEGFSELLSGGGIGGFAIFTYTPNGQAAVAPLETRNASSYLLPFDNTGGLSTGLAIANLASSTANVNVVIRNDSGAQISPGSLQLAAQGHASFMLTDATFPATAGVRGTVEFDTPAGGRIAALGLRASPIPNTSNFAVTSLPVLAGVGAGGGVIPHIVSGAGWQTTLTLVNTGAAAAAATLSFFGDSGSALALPLSFPQTGTSSTAASVSQSIPAGGTLIVVVQDTGSAASTSGSAVLTTSGDIGAFAIFRYNPTGQEAVVPLQTVNAASYILAFDNTGSLSTGFAIANGAAQAASVKVTIRNDAGADMGTALINLPAQGHTSFMLTDTSSGGWAATAGVRGTVEFDTPSGGAIAPLGLRAATIPGGFTITTVPVMQP
jgi:sugar lactone lactonase YvrE